MEVYRMLKLSLKEGEYVNIGDNIRVVYATQANQSNQGVLSLLQ